MVVICCWALPDVGMCHHWNGNSDWVGVMLKAVVIGLNETVKKLEGLKQEIAEKATMSAINKTATQTRNYAVRLIRKEYLLSSGDLKDKITIVKANKKRLEARVISIRGNGSLLITKYSARMTKKGLSVKVKRSGKRVVVKDAFLTPDGKPLKRTGEKNYVAKKGYWAGKRHKRGPMQGQPILRQKTKALYGPTVADIFGYDLIYDELIKFSRVKLVEVFMNELKFYTKKHFPNS